MNRSIRSRRHTLQAQTAGLLAVSCIAWLGALLAVADPQYLARVTMNFGDGHTTGDIEVRRIERATNMPHVAAQCGDERPLPPQLALAVDRRPNGVRDTDCRHCVRDVSAGRTVVVSRLERTPEEERRGNEKSSARMHLTSHKISDREPVQLPTQPKGR